MKYSAELEFLLVDLQRFNRVVKSGCWNPKFGRRTRWTGNPPSAIGQRGLDYLPLAPSLTFTFGRQRRLSLRLQRRTLFGNPQFVYGKNFAGTQNHGPFDYVLQLANVARPIVRLQQVQRPFVNRLDILADPLRVAPHEVFDQHQDVISPLS